MITQGDIELFILKNAALTKQMRSVYIEQKILPSRGVLESQADSLIDKYIRQIDYEILADADRMSEFYKLFYALENDIRDLVESTINSSVGDTWWETNVPAFVKENAKKNQDREAAEGLPPRSDRMLDYTTFGELGEIIKENWDTFSGMFSNASKNRVVRVLSKLNLARGPIAHCNYLQEEEAIKLKLAIRDWYKLME